MYFLFLKCNSPRLTQYLLRNIQNKVLLIVSYSRAGKTPKLLLLSTIQTYRITRVDILHLFQVTEESLDQKEDQVRQVWQLQ